MFDKNILGERIYTLRKENNLTQKQLGDIAGVSYSTIVKIENKQRATSIDVIYAIAEHFKISANWLLGLSDKRELE